MAIPNVIGITGKARSGKDTTANFIQAAIGGYRYSFASPLKAMLKAGFGIDMNTEYWEANKETIIEVFGKSPRQMLQTLGTEWGRELVNQNVWLILAHQQLLQHGRGMIIPDVRFQNEANWIRDKGGMIIHVRRSAAPEVSAHASEQGVTVEPGDTVLVNDGSLEDLQAQIKALFHVI